MSYIIGIDLGTTNSTLSFSQSGNLDVQPFEIMQPLSATLEGKKSSLPSFYFYPLEKEIPCVGWYAKERGAELPDRVVASAKSWLCHDMIDRRTPFLPLSDFAKKVSPVEVCTAFLTHLRVQWEKEYPEIPFSEQRVLVTVPASFDPGARSLVSEAAHAAGYPEVRLMEEPLAAFYAWLYARQDDWRSDLKVGDTLLVIDIGGGTTDFSLIAVEENEGELSLERKAVGSHLLLGGDNIDLALAHQVISKFPTPLDEWQFQSLVHSCRNAKEELLGINPPKNVTLTIQGRGSSLIGGSLHATLTKEEIEALVVDGFFPKVGLDEPLVQEKRSGIAKIGLPYARDPRITAQLAHFLTDSKAPLPKAVLFNGGTMKAEAFQKRILSLLTSWKGEEVHNLEGGD